VVLSIGRRDSHSASARARNLHTPFDLHQFLLFSFVHIHLSATPERNKHIDGEVFHGLISVDADVTGHMRDLVHSKGNNEVWRVSVPHGEEEREFRINSGENALDHAGSA
jgi:hypothetical protein